ncbi:related to EXO1-exonuclease which interacts with Msh2p [Sporisorium reilianum f. sp. reilianum]|uniref:Related to EXO1-exonuclease which interacts with Msh2p n=1 Tax=Sporisorium reilianum f. sp. reilianum TaxID=72559 RepID=A0A2N8UEJ8_9BASI|nr:related to EXO1-exonuclease which interacts with Msh2p [Sporisorium reilianum f. sp. reilianum]
MGIQGLLPLLKDIQTPVHVSSYAGKTLGVDAYVWLHRGAYGCAREIVLGDPTPRYIAHALSRIRMLQHFGVKPYFVFDGDKLPAKSGTEDDREQRRSDNLRRANELEQQGNMQQARDVYAKCVDITPEMAFQLIKVLKEERIPYVVAPYEADAQLAYLEAEGIIDGIITEDSDLLVFGCKTVLFKLDQAGNAVEMLQQRFWTNRQIALSGWTAVEFRQMAILSGCDYLPSIVGMGLKNAHRLLRRYKTVDKVLQAVRLEGKMRVPPTYAREFRKAELTFVHQRVFDPRSQKLVTLTPLPDGTHDEMLPFIGAAMEDDVAKGVADGTIDPIARTPIVDRVPKTMGARSSSASNVASTSGGPAAGPQTLHRSATAPTTLSGGGSFYKASSSAKKKVVSKEAGLQSLTNFFRGPTANTSASSTPKQERAPLAPRDVNRIVATSAPGPTQSKFFASKSATPSRSQDAKLDHAYLHLGGQLTPPKARQDPNDSGYWDDECDDMHDFVRSSSPARAASVVAESQPLVMDTQELWQTQTQQTQTQVVESVGGSASVVATQVVVVPQTPSRGSRKRMHSGFTENEEGLSSPESAMGSGFISSPASSLVKGEAPLAGSASPAGGEEDGEDEVQAEPMTPLAMRNGGARKPMLHTSASMSKLEAFRYSVQTPQQQQSKPSTANGLSPSVLKLSSSASTHTRTPVPASRPNKVLKRSPTLLLGEQAEDEDTNSCGRAGGGLFDRFRFSEAAHSSEAKQFPF